MATAVSIVTEAPERQLKLLPAPAEKPATPPDATRPKQYLFIHTVRFWSILAIVVMHCAFEIPEFRRVPVWELALLVQPFKFGTIAFFVISGFLVGDRLPKTDPLRYMWRRAARLLPAWAIWFSAWVLYTSQRSILHVHSTGVAVTGALVASTLRSAGARCLLTTPLWFVPNFLLALTCVVLLRRWLHDLRLGVALLVVSLFYGVNVYARWLPAQHSQALFAFVFYLWLGAWCGLRKEKLQAWATARSPRWLSFWAIVATGIALGESWFLAAHGSSDWANTLRFGNQIYSVLVVILLVRIQRRSWPAGLNVGETTYGIYLIHPVVIRVLVTAALKVLAATGLVPGTAGVLLLWAILCPAVYILSLQITRLFASSEHWGWVVGASQIQPRAWFAPRSVAHGSQAINA